MRSNNDITMLVNKENPLTKDYVPEELIAVDENENNFHNFIDSNMKPMIDKRVYEDYLKLVSKAKEDGFILIIDSGYRSFEFQKVVLELITKEKGEEYASKFVALPGYSEHQTGLAIDFAAIHDNVYDEDLLDEEIEWLKNNAYKYGFVLRFPEGKEEITGYAYEPWHYRYVGKLSTLLYKNNITLEEYYLKKYYYDSDEKINK